MKTVQYISEEYLNECKKLSSEQILQFLENFAELHYSCKSKSKLISIEIPENMLAVFKQKCKQEGINYQTKIKVLMQEFLK